MANSLSLLAKSDNYGILECPECGQTINILDSKCPYCSITINAAEAEAAAKLMSKVNQACSDASYLTTLAFSILIFWGLQFVPFITLLGIVG